MKTHANIPIFIPHEGCKNDCVFCNQRTITGTNQSSDRDIVPEIENALATIKDGVETEIAFFGGSFTGIGIEKMTRLCDTAYEYVKRGKVKSIRLSTRPDYIDEEILGILKSRGVTHIELGIQSMSQKVLDVSQRAHTIYDTQKACELILKHGFVLGGQMMIGLCESTLSDEIETAKEIVRMGASEARIYPTVVFYGTKLCDMAKSGLYSPLSVEEAVERSAAVYGIFKKAGVNVLRIGLQSSENLSSHDEVFAGANHPALGELVEGEYFYSRLIENKELFKTLANKDCENRLIIYCSNKSVSKVSGQNKKNKTRLLYEIEKYGYIDVKIKGNADFDEDRLFFICENTTGKRRKENSVLKSS